MLQAVEDFLAAVADDFAEPHAAVHVHKERAFSETSRLSVGHNVGVNEAVPDFDDLDFAATRINAVIGQHLWNDRAGFSSADGLRGFQRGQINAVPLGKHTLARRCLERTAWRNMSWRRWNHRSRDMNY